MKLGTYHQRFLPVEDRFWEKVRKTDTCWLWVGTINKWGYGRFRPPGTRQVGAHRWAYEQEQGSIPVGLQLDHLCRVRHCVNPLHLEAVTPKENTRRGLTGEFQRSKTHCPQGHSYDSNNTYLFRGKRNCRTCQRARGERRRNND